jgi:hypothetical protein
VHEVHRPSLVQPRRRRAIVAQLCSDPVLWRLVAQAQLAIDPLSSCERSACLHGAAAHECVDSRCGLALPLSVSSACPARRER